MWRLKPQEIIAISKITLFKPLLRILWYDLFHLIVPNAPSACMLLFIRSNAPWTLLRLLKTSLWNLVNSSFKRITRLPSHLQHLSLWEQLVQSSHWYRHGWWAKSLSRHSYRKPKSRTKGSGILSKDSIWLHRWPKTKGNCLWAFSSYGRW